jgi:hypothetical protein
MYKTPEGTRILEGAERTLFIESLAMIVDNLTVMEQTFGIAVVDNLQHNQQIALFHNVGRALLCRDEPVPPLTAVLEGGVAAIWRHIRNMISMELNPPLPDTETDSGSDCPLPTWRERVLAACRETEPSIDLPPVDNEDLDEWDSVVTHLEDRVLWDTDWEMAEMLDADPDMGEAIKETMGITPDYFVAVPPDPSDLEAKELLVELVELTRDVRFQGEL